MGRMTAMMTKATITAITTIITGSMRVISFLVAISAS